MTPISAYLPPNIKWKSHYHAQQGAHEVLIANPSVNVLLIAVSLVGQVASLD